jgi:hypothetical protein
LFTEIEGLATVFPDGGVASFTISAISPAIDASNPDAFPLQLEFNTETASFVQQAESTPEPSTLTMFVAALGGLTLTTRKKRD